MLEKHDVTKLAKEYQKNKFISIKNFIDADLAKKLYKEFPRLP